MTMIPAALPRRVLTLSLFVLPVAPLLAQEPAATLTAISRRVEHRIAGDEWADARVGYVLRERDGLRTGPRASAAASVVGVDLALGESSLVLLRDLSRGPEGVPSPSVEIVQGQADIRRGAAGTRPVELILGPTRARGRAAAGGDVQLRARRRPDGSAQVMSYRGSTDVAAPGGRIALAEGMGAEVRRDGTAGAAEALLPAPAAVEPKADETLDHSNPTFRWFRVPGAAAYVVEVCSDVVCGSVVERSARQPDNRWTVLRLPLGKYFWRVTAVAPSGLDGYPGPAQAFEVKALWRRPPVAARGVTSPPRR